MHRVYGVELPGVFTRLFQTSYGSQEEDRRRVVRSLV